MDYALEGGRSWVETAYRNRFNPCSNGLCSRSFPARCTGFCAGPVSILVLMDYALEDDATLILPDDFNEVSILVLMDYALEE
jgi:hypothetical protein